MYVLPIESEDHRHDAIIVVLGRDNIERMAQADPVELRGSRLAKTLVNPSLLICHEDDSVELTRALASKDLKQILDYLMRGFRFRPEMGDTNDGGLPFVFRPDPLKGDK